MVYIDLTDVKFHSRWQNCIFGEKGVFLQNHHKLCHFFRMKERFISALIGIAVLVVFQPFDFPEFGWSRLVYVAGLFFIVTGSAFLSEMALRHVLHLPTNDISIGEPTLVRRNIWYQVFNWVIITIGIMLWNSATLSGEDAALSWLNFLKVGMMILLTSVMIGAYWRSVYHGRFLIKDLEEAQHLNGILQERERMNAKYEDRQPAMEPAPVALHFAGATKEKVECTDRDFFFAESDGNYVKIHYLMDGKSSVNAIRSSIKDVEETIASVSHICRCHRAFIVNLKHVESVESRSSGFYLKLHHCEALVPVSKTYRQHIKAWLNQPDG